MNVPISKISKSALRRGLLLALSAAALSTVTASAADAPAGQAAALATIKNYLVTIVHSMDGGAHDFVANAAAYQAIIDQAGGDYDKAASTRGVELGRLVKKMQADFGIYHNHGYETIEGITAGTARMVEFDVYLDAGVPKKDASSDSPSSPLVLKTKSGAVVADQDGNLFHYVIEPTLWGTRSFFLKKLSPDAQAKLKAAYEAELKTTLKASVVALPRADVLVAASIDCAKKIDELQEVAESWQPTLGECIGALVWMTPTLSGYFDDWRDSRFDAVATGHYVAESRVLDMRGIMYSLHITNDAIVPLIAAKNPGLADQLKSEYNGILGFIDKVESRDKQSNYKVSVPEIEEMAKQAKTLTDQLDPQLRQAAALLGVEIPPKP